MSNSAIITFLYAKSAPIHVYLHWNGGRHSILAFADYAKEVGLQKGGDALPRIMQIMGNYFRGTATIYLYASHKDATARGTQNGRYIWDLDTGEVEHASARSGWNQELTRKAPYYGQILEGVRKANRHVFGEEQYDAASALENPDLLQSIASAVWKEVGSNYTYDELVKLSEGDSPEARASRASIGYADDLARAAVKAIASFALNTAEPEDAEQT